MFAYWQTLVYFNIFTNIVNKKTAETELFLSSCPLLREIAKRYFTGENLNEKYLIPTIYWVDFFQNRAKGPGLGAANNFSYNSLWVEIYDAQ